MSLAYDELVDFIASGPSSAAVAEWQPSEETRDRVGDLIRAETAWTLSPEDAAELAHVLEIEHVMRLAKVRARQRMAASE